MVKGRKTSSHSNTETRTERKITINLSSTIIGGFLILAIGVFVGANWNGMFSQFMPYLGFKNTASVDWTGLNEVYNKLLSNYDGSVSEQNAIEYAKKGIAASVGDKYTTYMTASEAADFDKSLHGEVGAGIGVVMAERDGYTRVVRTLPDNPAQRAGILAGDIIYKINGEEVYNLDTNTIATKLRGNAGESVSLTIVRNGEEITYDLIREEINNVSAYIEYSGNTAIITVTRFDTDTGTIVKDFVKDFSAKGINKVILDLRDNGGGYVSAARDLLSLWIDSEAVLIQKSIHFPDETTYALHGQATLSNMRTIVLINGSTASASEIVAGALKNYHKATLVGEKTFGKGVVQSLIKLSNNTMLKVTTAHWYTPNGDTINGTGIEPDKEIVRTYDDINASRDPQLDNALAM
ncbi:S41 family peptidase [Candidatus Saccharibacteria bacterium]|nr:S41 family peptidase [Candidatus Saccharibacteria bacterium]